VRSFRAAHARFKPRSSGPPLPGLFFFLRGFIVAALVLVLLSYVIGPTPMDLQLWLSGLRHDGEFSD